MKYNNRYTKWIVLVGVVLAGFLIVFSILYSANAGLYEALEVEWMERYQDPTAPEQATVTFNGVTYTGTYFRSVNMLVIPYIYHTYRGDGYEFSIRSDSDQLCEFANMTLLKGASTVEKSYCRQLADSIVDDYFDLDEYLVEEEYHENKENYIMTYTYYKDFDGYQSADRFWIRINGNGEVEYFTMYGAGSFADVKSVSVNERKAKKAIKAKLEEMYAGTNASVDDFTMKFPMLIKLEDGSCAVRYEVGGLGEGYEAINMAVKVDYKKN